MQNQQISFENTSVNIIHKDGKIWMTLTDVARCLYDIPQTDRIGGLEKDAGSLEDAKRSVERIFKKKKDFIEKRGDTQLVKFKEGNLYRSYRIFSRSGLYSIAFAAQTPKAEAFQNFVLDLLEKYDNGQQSSKTGLLENVTSTLKSVLYANEVARKKREISDHLRQASEDMAKDYAKDSGSLKVMRENIELEITNILIMNSVQIEILLEGDSLATPHPSIHDFLERTSRHLSRR
jgi:prophage antirepressor-like protein